MKSVSGRGGVGQPTKMATDRYSWTRHKRE